MDDDLVSVRDDVVLEVVELVLERVADTLEVLVADALRVLERDDEVSVFVLVAVVEASVVVKLRDHSEIDSTVVGSTPSWGTLAVQTTLLLSRTTIATVSPMTTIACMLK